MVESLQYVAGIVTTQAPPTLLALSHLFQPMVGIASMEERLPARANAKQSSEEQTLWEGEQIAIRYLLEEGVF